ncbi:hypothetical protein CEXT_338491 [Caerostris extrusa]|uniref:Uncharacterized protein n=1 Tax=Caerostris extrusa TaxID=172846 RepID=A0AAV4WKI3_CAEEX|nr:hypothetical protein CEXT_338491 [Caerostris extrusa]
MSFQKAVRVRGLATIMVFMGRNCSQFELKGVVFEEGICYDRCHLGCQNQSVPKLTIVWLLKSPIFNGSLQNRHNSNMIDTQIQADCFIERSHRRVKVILLSVNGGCRQKESAISESNKRLITSRPHTYFYLLGTSKQYRKEFR